MFLIDALEFTSLWSLAELCPLSPRLFSSDLVLNFLRLILPDFKFSFLTFMFLMLNSLNPPTSLVWFYKFKFVIWDFLLSSKSSPSILSDLVEFLEWMLPPPSIFNFFIFPVETLCYELIKFFKDFSFKLVFGLVCAFSLVICSYEDFLDMPFFNPIETSDSTFFVSYASLFSELVRFINFNGGAFLNVNFFLASVHSEAEFDLCLLTSGSLVEGFSVLLSR